jgi:hypothetical protein
VPPLILRAVTRCRRERSAALLVGGMAGSRMNSKSAGR